MFWKYAFRIASLSFRVIPGHVQIVRGLLMGALSVGMLGFILSLLGMECTYIGGKDQSKYKKIYTGGCCHILSGKCLVFKTKHLNYLFMTD